jgi:hypothetical protein
MDASRGVGGVNNQPVICVWMKVRGLESYARWTVSVFAELQL